MDGFKKGLSFVVVGFLIGVIASGIYPDMATFGEDIFFTFAGVFLGFGLCLLVQNETTKK